MKNEFIEDNLMILSKQTFDEFLKQNDTASCLTLYLFYYYNAQQQQTNQPKVTNSYVARALGWGDVKIMSAKRTLINMRLIESVSRRGTNGKIIGWHINLNHLKYE